MTQTSNPGRRERKKQDTRQKIAKIAIYLFRKQGFDATTMEQIADQVDISKATLYNYYPTKEIIISEYWQSSVKELKLQILELVQLLPDTRSRIQKIFTKTATELFKSKQDIYEIYLSYWLRNLNNPAMSNRLKSGFEDIFAMTIRLGQQSGDVRKDISVELMVKQLEIMFLTACMQWLSDPKLFPLEKTLSLTVSLFMDGSGVAGRQSRGKADDRESTQGRLL